MASLERAASAVLQQGLAVQVAGSSNTSWQHKAVTKHLDRHHAEHPCCSTCTVLQNRSMPSGIVAECVATCSCHGTLQLVTQTVLPHQLEDSLATGWCMPALCLVPLLIVGCVPQIEGMIDSIKTATAAPSNPVEAKIHKANEGFLQGEGGKQQLLLR